MTRYDQRQPTNRFEEKKSLFPDQSRITITQFLDSNQCTEATLRELSSFITSALQASGSDVARCNKQIKNKVVLLLNAFGLKEKDQFNFTEVGSKAGKVFLFSLQIESPRTLSVTEIFRVAEQVISQKISQAKTEVVSAHSDDAILVSAADLELRAKIDQEKGEQQFRRLLRSEVQTLQRALKNYTKNGFLYQVDSVLSPLGYMLEKIQNRVNRESDFQISPAQPHRGTEQLTISWKKKPVSSEQSAQSIQRLVDQILGELNRDPSDREPEIEIVSELKPNQEVVVYQAEQQFNSSTALMVRDLLAHLPKEAGDAFEIPARSAVGLFFLEQNEYLHGRVFDFSIWNVSAVREGGEIVKFLITLNEYSLQSDDLHVIDAESELSSCLRNTCEEVVDRAIPGENNQFVFFPVSWITTHLPIADLIVTLRANAFFEKNFIAFPSTQKNVACICIRRFTSELQTSGNFVDEELANCASFVRNTFFPEKK